MMKNIIKKLVTLGLSVLMMVSCFNITNVFAYSDEQTDYSNVIEFDETEDVVYNDDKSNATVTFTLNTEDEVHLDFNNNDDISKNIEDGNYGINSDLTTENQKVLSFNIVKNGEYTFDLIALDSNDNQVGSKTVTVSIDDLTNDDEVENEYDTNESASGSYDEVKSIEVGDRYTFNVKSRSVNWSSSKSSVATVNNNGTVTAIATGETVISAQTNHKTYQYKVTVVSSSKNNIVAQVVKSSDDTTYGKNAIKVRYEDEDGNDISLNGGTTTFNFDKTSIEINKATFTQTTGVLPDGYVFDDAYFFWSGHYSGTKYSATEFKNFGSKVTWYDSYLGFKCNNGSQKADKDGYYAYNPTGVLHLVYKKVSQENPYKIFYINEYSDYDEQSSYVKWDDTTEQYKYYFKATSKENPTKEGYTFKGWNTKRDGSGTWALDYKDNETEMTSDIYFYAIYEENAYGVTYNFTSATDGKDLPESVTNLLPSDTNKYAVGRIVSAQTITNTLVQDTDGYWTFNDWDSSSKEMTSDGITFNGSWTFNNYKEITVKAKSASYTYDGKEHSIDACELEESTFTVDGEKYTVTATTFGISAKNVKFENGEISSYPNKIDAASVVVKDSQSNVVTQKFKITSVDGSLTITKRNVTIESGSKSKKYDRTALTYDKITISDDKFVKGEEPTFKTTGTITNVGTTKNTIEVVKYSDKYIADNYNLTFNEGTLEVKQASGLKVTVKDAKKVYDGTTLTSEATSKVEGTTILYSIDNGKTWSEKAPSITDAGKQTVKVKATNPNYKDATASYKLEVTQREVTITSNSDSKTYDGTPLTNSHYKITKGSFVKGENVTIQTTGSITDVGKTDNTIEVTYGDNCNANNYKVTLKLGTLEVKAADFKLKNLKNVPYNGLEQKQEVVITDKNGNVLDHSLFEITYSKDTKNAGKVTVTVKAKKNTNYSGTKTESYDIEKTEVFIKTNSGSKIYDGTALTADGSIEGLVNGETVTFTVTGSQTDVGTSKNTYDLQWNGTANKDNYVVKSDCGKLTVEAAQFTVDDLENVKYDGTNQKLSPVVKNGDKTLTNKKDYTVTYSGDTKNVGTVTVTVKGKGNYTGTVTKTYEITKRDVTLTSKSDEKVFDGTPLTNSEVAISGDGFVEGEGATYTVTGTITDVGSADNSFSYELNNGTKAGNYNITTANGTLTVTSKSFPTPVDPEDPSKGENESDVTIGTLNDVVYNGLAQEQEPTIEDSKLGTLEKDKDYTLTYTDATNVGTVTVTITGIGNYTGSTTRAYNITKAPLTITTDSASKPYDGSALTATGKIEGLVNGETATFAVTGTIIDEGEVQNTYSLTWDGTAKEDNYEVVENLGTLKIEATAPVVTPDSTVTPATTPVANNTTPTTPVTPTRRTTPVTPVTPVVTPTSTPEATVEPTATTETTPTPSATATAETIDDDSTPEAAPNGQWALINLVAALASVLLGVIVILSKHSDDDDDDNDSDNGDDENTSTRHRRWKVIAGIDAVAAVVTFILTENITNPMVLVDKWTILMVAFALIAVVSTYFGRKWHEDEEDEDSSENA